MPKTIVGVMGPGENATPKDCKIAFELGTLFANQGWVVLTGGRNTGVMEAACKGAKKAGGLTIGILPAQNRAAMSGYVDIPITTGMGSARNNINVLSSDVIVACGSGLGTTSEIMLALKAKKPLLLINQEQSLLTFLYTHGSQNYYLATSPKDIVDKITTIL